MGWSPCEIQEPKGPAPTLMVSSPSLPSPILCLGKLHPTGLSYFRPYSECSPLPLPMSKQAPSGKTGALNFKWERYVYVHWYTLSLATLSLWLQKVICALSRLCFCLSNPTGQGLMPGSPHFHLGLLQPSISCPTLSLCPTYWTPPLLTRSPSVLLVPPLPG